MIQNLREKIFKNSLWIKIIQIIKIRNIWQKDSSKTMTKTRKNQRITIHALLRIIFSVCYLPFFSQGFANPSDFCPTFESSTVGSLTREKMMIVIVPYWVDTNSGSSSVLLSDVRIFKGFFVSCLTRHTSQWQCHYQTFDG